MSKAMSNANANATDRGKNGSDSLWAAIRQVAFSRGYVNHLADQLGVSAKDLYRYATDPTNITAEHRQMPAEMIVPLTKATDDITILEWLAAQCGCVVTRRPEPASTAGPLSARVGA